ncbi:PD-(D/E)XK nuclease family protein [Halolamina salifodinae]|uniref:PD-(D/E)XK endonuclease-like domain-containing protein n=1 Tax=Halolamina salifodinae TaxID=1202767 RepID=A0A8T4H1T1_9EURY|nr:PD-(D/E)XK nuclease family protein [Halolamina salifodinae]MBP1987744.1 hypothetical protein [Halolamina salifodinae]
MAPSEAADDGPPALSPARLNLLVDCERCFWVRMQRGETRPEEAFPSVVSGVEREVRAAFERHREAGTLPPALRTARLDATLVDDDAFLSACRTWQRDPTVTDPDTGAVLRGAMDDLLELADGAFVPLDYKTHGTPPETVYPGYQRQLECYGHLLAENGHRTAPFGLLLYVYPTGDGPITFDTELRWVRLRPGRPRALMRRAVRVLAGSVPEYSEDCEFCSWAETA